MYVCMYVCQSYELELTADDDEEFWEVRRWENLFHDLIEGIMGGEDGDGGGGGTFCAYDISYGIFSTSFRLQHHTAPTHPSYTRTAANTRPSSYNPAIYMLRAVFGERPHRAVFGETRAARTTTAAVVN